MGSHGLHESEVRVKKTDSKTMDTIIFCCEENKFLLKKRI